MGPRKKILLQLQKRLQSKYSSIGLGVIYGLFMFLFVSYLILHSPTVAKEEPQKDDFDDQVNKNLNASVRNSTEFNFTQLNSTKLDPTKLNQNQLS